MHTYNAKEISTCIPNRRVVFIGDSVTRQLFFQFVHTADPSLPTSPPSDDHKHEDYTFNAAASSLHVSFIWDPYLNSSQVQSYLSAVPSGPSLPSLADSSRRPALLVLGSGLWYLRYAESGGLPAWEAKMESTLSALHRAHAPPADTIVLLPVSDVVHAKLSRERAETMQGADIDAMNSDLRHRVHPPPPVGFSLLPAPPPGGLGKDGRPPVALPLVFNAMLDASQTEDGLHFSNAVVGMQAQVLLNLACNDVMPKTFPMDRTCCRRYPWPSPLHSLVLAVAVLWGPACVLLARRVGESLGIYFLTW